MNVAQPSKFRTLLILGRVSNLPTVWSNCLAGWWLAGGGPWRNVVCISIAVSLLYVGGMFLNDAFDAGFDRSHRKSRPIPSGAISEKEVWGWGFVWLILGVSGLVWLGKAATILAVALAGCILLYDAIHKMVIVAPVLMGACRLLVYLTAASAGLNGVNGEVVWKSIGLASYVVGLSFLARKESAPSQIQYWPGLLLAAPVIIAGFQDDENRWGLIITSAVFVLWVTSTLLQAVGQERPNIGRAVSRLLAGIVLVDCLAMADLSGGTVAIFALCFVGALALQRAVPAT